MMKTRTEIFEEVKVHLLSQGVRSYAEGACYYRHPQQDLQCAAGCLIPDGMYEPEMEGLSWVDVCRDFDGLAGH